MNQTTDNFYGAATTMMTVAIRSGQTSVVRWLFDRSVCPTYELLKQAFHYQRSEIVQTFLDMDFLSLNPLVSSEDVLTLAVQSNLGDIYRYLIKKGANINYRDQEGRTLLFQAVSNPRVDDEIIEDLLLAGMDLSAQDNTGRTPLSLSVWGERQPGSFSLLAREICTRPTFKSSEDLLRHVLQSREYHIACLLLHYGLDLMLEDVDMRTEWIEILAVIGRLPSAPCDMLVSKGTRTQKLSNNPKDQTYLAGQTLLSLAALFRHEKAFQVLLDWGIDPTCPAIAELRKKMGIVTQIGESTSRPEPLAPKRESNNYRMSDELRQGPLAWAAYTGNLPLVQSILDRGLDPNIQNSKGQTALYFAVQQTENKCSRKDLETDKEEIVRLLLQNGALVASADANGGATVVAHAFRVRYSKVAKVLLENGAEIPKGALAGPAEQLWDAFKQEQDGICQALLERIQSARVESLDSQTSSSSFCWSGDPLSIAAQLMWGGTMRALGDVVLTAYGHGA